MSTNIVSIANQKGGVGKTTTVVNLAAVLADMGRTVLVVDLDPQANATSGLGVEPRSGVSIYSAVSGNEDIADIISGTAFERVNVVPSEVNLAGAEVELARMADHLHWLDGVLAKVVESEVFDYILIDCPPSLGVLMSNALAASDSVIVPMQCEYYAMEGLSIITNLVNRIKNSGANPRLDIEGIVMTMFTRTRLSEDVVAQVREHYPDVVYSTMIPRSVRAGEAPSYGMPVVEYAPSSPVAAAYRDLGKEFLKRHKAFLKERRRR